MNKQNIFFYEHIGHMQFSVLTLETFKALNSATNGEINTFVDFNQVKELIMKTGFTEKQSVSELDRFCYGFECIDKFDSNGNHKLAFTEIGQSFLKSLINESENQSAMIAFLMRPAKRKLNWNITIQESTFFNTEIYELIAEYKFRQGGARDFIRTLALSDFLDFLERAIEKLSYLPKNMEISLDSCIEKVKKHGKYWASVSGKYSWFVYSQKFCLPFDTFEWSCYDELLRKLIRPTEWGGGGNDVSYKEILRILKDETIFHKFRNNGIIRPIWTDLKIENALFRLTAPGYLMWERKKKGFIYEFQIKRIDSEICELALCDAFDFPTIDKSRLTNKSSSDFINWSVNLHQEEIRQTICSLLMNEKNLFSR